MARYKLLVDKNEIPRQQYDTAVALAAGAQATLDSRHAAVREAEQNIAVAQSAIDQANQRIPQAEASIESAMTAPKQVAVSEARAKSAMAQVAQRKALLDQAKLNLSYCTIVAPVTRSSVVSNAPATSVRQSVIRVQVRSVSPGA